MKKCLEILATPSGRLSSDPEEDFMTRENALEHLESVVDIIDNAKGTEVQCLSKSLNTAQDFE